MNTKISAIILAGGFGTRLRSAIPDLPKPMAPINGRPFLEYQIDYWIGQGIRHFVLSIGYLHPTIISHFGKEYSHASIEYIIEKEPLGTGGGLLLAMEAVNHNQPFLLLNGDTFFEVDLKKLLNFHANNSADWTFSLFRSEEKGRYMGLNVSAEGKILSLHSNPNSHSVLVNGGVYLVNPSALSEDCFITGKKYSLEEEILPNLINSGLRMFGCEFSGQFIDIGIPNDYLKAIELLTSK